MAKPRALSDRQRKFVGEYLIHLNATKAAVRAGYSPRWPPIPAMPCCAAMTPS